MAESMLREEVEVYSEKYDIHGVVRDYGMVTKLFFTYGRKDIVMGVHRNILKGEKYEDLGRNIPVAMSRECFDLGELAVGKVLEMRADINADFSTYPPEEE